MFQNHQSCHHIVCGCRANYGGTAKDLSKDKEPLRKRGNLQWWVVGRSQEASGYQDPQWHPCFLNVLPPKNLLSSVQLYILKGEKLVMDN